MIVETYPINDNGILDKINTIRNEMEYLKKSLYELPLLTICKSHKEFEKVETKYVYLLKSGFKKFKLIKKGLYINVNNKWEKV